MSMKKYLALVLSAIFVMTLALPCFSFASGDFAGGDGTAQNPYLISTKQQLDKIRYHLDSNFKLTNDIVFEDADYKEDGAFYNGGARFLPIGDEENPFKGTIDGNNFSISYLKQNLTSGAYGGFIGFGEDCAIKNITFTNSLLYLNTAEKEVCAGVVIAGASKSFNAESVSVKNGRMIIECDEIVCIGGLGGAIEDGFAKSCTVAECDFELKTTTESTTEKTTVAGQLFGAFYGESIENCTIDKNELTVESFSGEGGASVSVGGVVGLTNANIENVSVLNFTKTVVEANGNFAGALNVFAGGIAAVAQNDAGEKRTITASTYEGTIGTSAISAKFGDCNVYSGGLVGMAQNYIVKDAKIGPETAAVSAVAKINDQAGQAIITGGGIVGYALNSKLINLENYEDSLFESNADTGICFRGGIAGIAENCEIINSRNKSVIRNTKASDMNVIGGIAGQQLGGSISACFNLGSLVTGSGAEIGCMGGITGASVNGAIHDCYNKGDFDAENSIAEVGGIVGELENAQVRNCYSQSGITYTSQEAQSAYLGHIAGAALGSSKTDDCYYMIRHNYLNINGEIFNDKSILIGIGGYEETSKVEANELSEAQMSGATNFTGFDFENVWMAGKSAPELRANPESTQTVKPTPTVTPMPTPTPPPDGMFAIGDINADGKINSRDLSTIQKHVIGLHFLSADQESRADVTADGKINSRDIAALQRIVLAG